MSEFSTFLQLQKVDISKREVWGTAALEQPDKAREIMDYEKSLPNFLNWSRDMQKASGGLSMGNVRAMHRDVAAGKVIHLEPRDDTKSIYVGAKIVDDNEWKKVLEGVYTGFSVGGSYGKKWADSALPGYTRYEALPVEISLVDVPCMPGAMFEIVKADGASEMRKFVTGEADLAKGDFDGHPFRGNQYTDASSNGSGRRPIEKTNRGHVVRSEDKSKTAHIRPNNKNQNYEVSIISENGDEFMTYANSMDDAHSKASDAVVNPSSVVGNNSGWWKVKKSLGVAELLKEVNMEPKDLLTKLAASSDPAMQELAEELNKAFPPAKEKKDEESDSPDAGDKKQAKKNPFEAESKDEGHEEPDGDEGPNPEAESDEDGDESAEAEEQPEAGQPSTEQTEAIRAVVIQLLEELGFVQEQGGQPGAPTAVKFVTADALQKRLSTQDELKKQYDALKDRQTSLTEDLAKLITNVDEMVKRGGPAPVIRDLGALTPELVAAEQQSSLLKGMISQTSDPVAKQALQAELTKLEIKKTQTQPQK